MLTTVSCTQRIVYKTKIEYVTPPVDWVQPCKAVPVADGARSKEELLKLLSVAYIDTLKNINACNIKTRQTLKFIETYSIQNTEGKK